MIPNIVSKTGNKKKFALFSLLVILSLISLTYILTPTKNPLPVIQPPNQPDIQSSNSETRGLSYSVGSLATTAVFPTLPQSLETHSVSLPSTGLESLAAKLATKFNLKQDATYSNAWASSDNSQVLNADLKSSLVSYYVDAYITPSAYSGSARPMRAKSLNVANDFVSGFSEFKGLSLVPDAIKYYSFAFEDAEPSSPEKADLIEIPFSYVIAQSQTFISGQTSYPLVITTGQKDGIVKVAFYSQPFEVGSSTDRQTLTGPEALDQLKQGQATIISHTFSDPGKTYPQKLPPLTIVKIELVNRLNPAQKQIEPYYQFTGTYNLDPLTKGEVILILSAIKP